jgi:hypothetical protein
VRNLKLRLYAAGLGAAVAVASVATTRAALAADQVHDEIQVYNAEIAEVGQWTYEQHFNYAWRGQTQPEFPGGFVSNHSLQGTPEFAYGITDWWEGGFYLPFAVTGSGEFLSDGAKIRSLFVVPDAAKRSFFYGVNFELGYELPQFSLTRWNAGDTANHRGPQQRVGVHRQSDRGCRLRPRRRGGFRPGVRLARNLGEDRFIGLEYYADFGRIGDFLPLQQQSQQLFAVTDFKVRAVDVELGVGYGFTPGSDGLVVKAIIGYAFPVPGKSDEGGSSPNTPLAMGTSPRPSQTALIVK